MTTLLLKGLVGSKAYGLDTKDSDDDFLGVFAYPTERLFLVSGLGKETLTTKDPDTTMHEARKYCQLALQCNPTAMELLWLDSYVATHPLGWALRGIRTAFLDREKVRGAYLGYAKQQLLRLKTRATLPIAKSNQLRAALHMEPQTEEERWAKRAKHGRHVYRLMEQARRLEEHGHLTVRLPRSEADATHVAGLRAADGDVSVLEHLIAHVEWLFSRSYEHSAMPMEQDLNAINVWLTEVRLNLLTARL